MKKYLLTLAFGLCFFSIPHVTITHAAGIPNISVSPIEPGDREIDVVVTNYNSDMDGYLVAEVGNAKDDSYVNASTYFSCS